MPPSPPPPRVDALAFFLGFESEAENLPSMSDWKREREGFAVSVVIVVVGGGGDVVGIVLFS